MKRITRNGQAEEAAIQRGIAADPDAAEWTLEDFTQAHHAIDVMPTAIMVGQHPIVPTHVSSRRKRR